MKGVGNIAKLKIVEWNVRGLHHRRGQVRSLCLQADIVAVCETWTRPGDTTENSWITAQQPAPCNKMGRRQGGVALIVNPLYTCNIIAKYADEDLQFIAANVADVIIICAYFSPTTKTEKAKRTISIWNTLGNRIVIIGDLNARHRIWDRRTFPMGSLIVNECRRLNWKIWAPKDPTCFSPHGSSVIDLAISKNQQIDFVKAMNDKHSGSDHIPIYIQYSAILMGRKKKTRIPISQRLVDRYIQRAETELPREIQKMKRELNNVTSQTLLDQWYDKLKSTILQYWREANTSTLASKVRHTNNKAKRLRIQRSKQYRKAKKSGNIDEEIKYDILNKEYRRIIRQWRELNKKNKLKRLGQADGTGMVRQIKRMLEEEVKSKQKQKVTIQLAPKEFTEYVHTKHERGFKPNIRKFIVKPEMIEDVEQAIVQAPTGKATGPDELFVESFKLFPKLMADILCALWAKCGNLEHVITEWQQGILVPIHKRGDKSQPKSYRPITLLSHARKVVEAGIMKSIGRQTKFDKTQTGFVNNMSTETALIRTTKHIREGRHVISILDLANAYNEVPRDKLMDIVHNRVNENTANMIGMCLQPLELRTRNDISDTIAVQNRGVPQGSPLSPILYNLYMDTYPIYLRENAAGEDDQWTVDLYADDVKIQTVNTYVLQHILNLSTEWAEKMGMKWSTKKCKVIKHDEDQRRIHLAGDELEQVHEVEYLGVSINSKGITDAKNIKRIRVANMKVNMLRNMQISNEYFTARRLRSICNTFIYPVANYALHLVPQSPELVNNWQRLDNNVIRLMFGIFQKRWEKKLRSIGRIPYLHERVGTMLQRLEAKLERRLENEKNTNTRLDIESLVKYRTDIKSPANMKPQQLLKNWRNLFRNHRRKIPQDTDHNYIPTMMILKGTYLNRCIRWYIGTFPCQPAQCIENGGRIAQKALQDMKRLMERTEWNDDQVEEVKQNIDILHEHEASSWRKRNWNEQQQGKERMGKKRKLNIR